MERTTEWRPQPYDRATDPEQEYVEEYEGRTYCKVALDGSAIYAQDARIRSAGYAVYYGPTHSQNLAFPLAGWEQTAQRGEVAALAALMETTRPTHLSIITDSRYVYNNMMELLPNKQLDNDIKHPDLWKPIQRVLGILRQQGHDVRIRHVNSHLTQTDVDEGRIDVIGFEMNKAVDSMATTAAKSHRPPTALAIMAKMTRADAAAYHVMLSKILTHRANATPLPHRCEGYSASDLNSAQRYEEKLLESTSHLQSPDISEALDAAALLWQETLDQEAAAWDNEMDDEEDVFGHILAGND